MTPCRVALATLGCRLNQSEGFSILQALQKEGFSVHPFSKGAQIYIVNTCTVTSRSDYKSRQMIRRALNMIPENGLVVVTGCYSQLAPQEILKLGGVHLVTGNVEKPYLHRLVMKALKDPASLPLVQVAPVMDERDFCPMEGDNFFGHSRAFLKIQDGCNHRCSYCTVWRARGPARSAPAPWVLSQVQRLAACGYREIVLTGINLGAYQWEDVNLTELLRILLEKGGMDRLRLSSIEPTEIYPELITLISEASQGVPGICPHLHIPMQSGSDRILSLMGRRYDSSGFKALAEELLERIPDLFLGVDVMVGFPTESEEDFGLTLSLLQELAVAGMHIFSYSPRAGTKASAMPMVPPEEKKKRYQKLQELKEVKLSQFMKGFVGREIPVLMEGRIDKASGLLRGLSTSYLTVLVEGKEKKVAKGRYYTVKITGAKGNFLIGRLCF